MPVRFTRGPLKAVSDRLASPIVGGNGLVWGFWSPGWRLCHIVILLWLGLDRSQDSLVLALSKRGSFDLCLTSVTACSLP